MDQHAVGIEQQRVIALDQCVGGGERDGVGCLHRDLSEGVRRLIDRLPATGYTPSLKPSEEAA